MATVEQNSPIGSLVQDLKIIMMSQMQLNNYIRSKLSIIKVVLKIRNVAPFFATKTIGTGTLLRIPASCLEVTYDRPKPEAFYNKGPMVS